MKHDWHSEGRILRCARCKIAANPAFVDVETLPLDCVPAGAAPFVRAAAVDRPQRLPGRLAVITCHFNPAGWRSLEDNYRRFLHAMTWWKLPVFTAEVVFVGQSRLSIEPLPHVVRTVLPAGEENILWQKERLLNLLVEQLPADVDKVAWIDADVLFLDRTWPQRVCAALERRPVVQLWDRWHCTDAVGCVGEVLNSVGPGAQRYGKQQSSPGGAWAARRNIFPLYDRHIVGSGDAMALEAWLGLSESYCMSCMTDAMRADYDRWKAIAWRTVQGSIDTLPGDLVHLYHGSRQQRRYVDRWKPVLAAGYDPQQHVAVDAQGLLAWTDSAPPQLVKFVREYFSSRQEDEGITAAA